MGDNHSLPLKSLSLKLVILLALSRPSRSRDLCNLDLRYMESIPNGVEFKPSSLAKQSRPSKPAASIVFSDFPADENLCPKEALLEPRVHNIQREEECPTLYYPIKTHCI